MGGIFDSVLSCDCLVFASPVYSWYCTPSLKAVMDRLVYSMNKYYGDTEGPCLWEGKCLALVTTCGYDLEHGAGVLEEGLRRYAVHSRLTYLGKLAVRDIDGIQSFTNEAAVSAARDFARTVFQAVKGKLSAG
jgi:multimeric flavodoxin WrbA